MLADTLAATGSPLSNKELVTYLLNGLGPSYEPFVTSITTRSDPITPHELYHLLLIHETRLSHNSRNTSPTFSLQPSVNLSTGQHRDQRGRSTYRGNRGSRGRNRGSYRGRSSQPFQNYPSSNTFQNNYSSSNTNRPICQVCSKPGHVALQCHYRFDHAYQYEPPQSFTANYTSSTSVADPTWYPDSAATYHLTHDLSHLNISSEPYTGHDQIRVGNGNGLPIENIGDSSFLSNSSSFHLHQLLHVPTITKNLVSVSQFCTDNSFFFEFHSNHFNVKDKQPGSSSSTAQPVMVFISFHLRRILLPQKLFSVNVPLSANGIGDLVIPLLSWSPVYCAPTVCHISQLSLSLLVRNVHLQKLGSFLFLLV
ncbi:uncharacterized protein LOC118347977 [Juglans regia]|uniref:Uncharacterized protein LOC118347977 n=1 Tax=Juglans regia TaxID=51240 RepID=A0A6P9E8N3_JUGRE|nr:uncharacterized protein LOC118347977 [Juglans regia]